MNIPVPENFNDNEMIFILNELVIPYCEILNPDITIIQAGTDSLKDDPQSKMILSNSTYWRTISMLKDMSAKTLILGGGGYNPYITAKAWAGNWLVLNSKEKLLQSKLTYECKEILRSLKWKNSRVRNGIPKKWLDKWIDDDVEMQIRHEVKEIVLYIQKIKKL